MGSSFLRGGRSITLKVPRNKRPMYSTVRFVLLLRPGCGPLGLGFGATPLPFRTRSFLPSVLTRTEVGYQPVGMNPRERLLPGTLMSNTARALTFALATKRSDSSRESVRLFGVEPGGASG